MRGLGRLFLMLTLIACGGGGSGDDPGDVAAELASPGDTEVTPEASPGDISLDVPAPELHGLSYTHEGEQVHLDNGIVSVEVDLSTGRLELAAVDGPARLRGATSRVRLDLTGEEETLSLADPGTRGHEVVAREDALGEGATLSLWNELPDGRVLTTHLGLRADASFVTAVTGIRWPGPAPAGAEILRISPLVVDVGDEGGLYLGADPAAQRMLDNGSDLYFDYDARLVPIGSGKSVFYGPGNVGNWNAAIVDPDTRASVIAGYLSADRGAGLIAAYHDAEEPVLHDGRPGLTRFELMVIYMEGRAPMDGTDGAGLLSEVAYLDLAPATPFEGLEGFARRHAAWRGKQVWTEIPTGWNSWGGGGGSGGLGTSIDAALMIENLDAAAEDFLPWGMKHFLLDDGWEDHEGDWNSHPERFPDQDGVEGMKWFADQVRARGMIPGLWISPFAVEHDSVLAAEHPEWIVDLNAIGQGLVDHDRHAVLDLSNPEVLDWLEILFTRVTHDWGYRWIKLDFSYYALFATHLHDPDQTVSEAFHEALIRIRQAMHPDAFFLTIAAIGMGMDVADGNRITLDNEPWWGDEFSGGDPGFKVIYRTTARRYYMNHNLWINHPDLLFYRSQFGLTPTEARAWTSAVALTGGIVKLGESYTDLHEHPEWRAMVTPLLPVYPRSARPLDLFEREFPELWVMEADREAARWHVVGLFNWGTNRDIGAKDYEDEAPRSYDHALADLGVAAQGRVLAFDAWAHDWRWIEDGRLTATLAPRDSQVLILRPEPDTPAVMATSRHLMGGAVEIHDEAWDADASTLTFKLDTVADHPFTVWVAAAGRTLGEATVEGATLTGTREEDGLVVIDLTANQPSAGITIAF
jgi:hypothetical protein